MKIHKSEQNSYDPMANGYAFVSKNYSSLRGGVFPNAIMNHDSSWNCLTERLALIGLIPKDVGGSGDCFFKVTVYPQIGNFLQIWIFGSN